MPKSLAERWSGRAAFAWRSRLPAVLLGLLLTVATAGCGGASSDPFDGTPGVMELAGPVTDLVLQTLVPPGSVELTAGAVHGTGPVGPSAVPVARAQGRRGVLDVVFLCEKAGRQVSAGYTWSDVSANLPCDPGPDTMSMAVGSCGGVACHLRNAFTFSFTDGAATTPPSFTVPAGASWTMLAWLAPSAVLPGSGVTAAGAGLARFIGYGLDFTYPRGWSSLVPEQLSGDNPHAAMVFEGSVRMPDPCPLTTDRSGVTTGGFPCGRAPVRALAPGGVLVTWSTTLREGWADGSIPGKPATIGGQPAWLFSGPASAIGLGVGDPPGVPAGPSCRDLGATWVVAATVSLGPGNADQMLACLRGPGTGTAVTQVLATLRSLRFDR